jgi:hypothetical protein
MANNNELRNDLIESGWVFFFNTNICFPSNFSSLYLNTESIKIEEECYSDLDKIHKELKLNEEGQKVYRSVSNLLNTITYKQSYEHLNEMLKKDNNLIEDPVLIVHIYSLLSVYKFRQPLRRYIITLLDKALNNDRLMEHVGALIASINPNMFI